jgi:septum formation protein
VLVLASQSPRRVELLNQIGVKYSQRAVDIDETPISHESPLVYVKRMAEEKSRIGWQQGEPHEVTLGADTIVVVQNEILGKPRDKSDFMRMLSLLSDNTHKVVTAVAVTSAEQQKSILVETQVCFGALSIQQINDYWQTGEPQDKAGGYGIQGLGGQFVKHLQGSYSAVVGLPLYQTRLLLTEFGLIHEC